MASIINSTMLKAWRLLQRWTEMGYFDSGTLYLCSSPDLAYQDQTTVESYGFIDGADIRGSGQGRQEVFIETEECSVSKVWLSITPVIPIGCQQACCGDVDFVSAAQPVPGGFVFSVVLNSNCARIDWIAQS